MLAELSVNEGSELGIDRRKDLGELLELGHRQPSGDKCLGHFEPDVSGSDDDSAGRLGFLKRTHDSEGVTHGVKKMYSVAGAERVGSDESVNRRPH